MKQLWTRREMEAPAGFLWTLLTEPEHWPQWGPSVRAATMQGDHMELGTTGTVRTALGVDVPFVITSYDPGVRWAWKVAGIGATDHLVEPLGEQRCRVSFGVPLLAAPYLAICRIALAHLHTMAKRRESTT